MNSTIFWRNARGMGSRCCVALGPLANGLVLNQLRISCWVSFTSDDSQRRWLRLSILENTLQFDLNLRSGFVRANQNLSWCLASLAWLVCFWFGSQALRSVKGQGCTSTQGTDLTKWIWKSVNTLGFTPTKFIAWAEAAKRSWKDKRPTCDLPCNAPGIEIQRHSKDLLVLGTRYICGDKSGW